MTWKHHETFDNAKYVENTAVLYQPPNSNVRNIYYFRSLEQRDIFIQSPDQFADSKLFTQDIPQMIEVHNAAQIISKEKNLANYCPVTLLEDGKIEKGYQLFLAFYKGNPYLFNLIEHKFIFENSAKLNRFMGKPLSSNFPFSEPSKVF